MTETHILKCQASLGIFLCLSTVPLIGQAVVTSRLVFLLPAFMVAVSAFCAFDAVRVRASIACKKDLRDGLDTFPKIFWFGVRSFVEPEVLREIFTWRLRPTLWAFSIVVAAFLIGRWL